MWNSASLPAVVTEGTVRLVIGVVGPVDFGAHPYLLHLPLGPCVGSGSPTLPVGDVDTRKVEPDWSPQSKPWYGSGLRSPPRLGT
jgi:hypothetical protein